MIRHNILTNARARDQFIQGCLALKQIDIGDGFSVYDFFPYWHHRAMWTMTPPENAVSRNAAHGGPSFGPWHRYMLLVFENTMRNALGDNDFRIPYWDWGADASDPFGSPVWSLLGGSSGLVTGGPLGTGSGFVVNLTQDGNSRQLLRTNRPIQRDSGVVGRTLPSTAEIVNTIRPFGSYERWPYHDEIRSFRSELEIPLHNAIHRFTGGDMMTTTSPNDPIFFLHHSNIDRIWAAWQSVRGYDVYQPGPDESPEFQMHRLTDRMHSLMDEVVRPIDVLDYRPYYEYDTIADVQP